MELAYMSDEYGPHQVLVVHDPALGFTAFAVVDNVACGPAIGGIRMAVDVTLDEVTRLARAMTWKSAAAGLPHGGGKAGIVADPAMPRAAKEPVIRAFGRAVRGLTGYIPGPDMGTDETCMAWLHDEIGRSAGIPRVLGGIPLDVVGATGFGLAVCAEAVEQATPLRLAGARVVIQGFGAVGKHAARFLRDRGARIVAVADIGGAVVNPEGLAIDELVAFKDAGNPMAQFPGGAPLPGEDLVAVDCDIWIPAARPDVLTAANAGRLKARYVLQGANIPATAEAEAWMHAHGVLSIPDFIANAGGVICASVEYHGGSQAQAFAAIDERIRQNTTEVLQRAAAAGTTPRAAAEAMARARVQEAQGYRR